jgi:hypothetical protein
MPTRPNAFEQFIIPCRELKRAAGTPRSSSQVAAIING